MKEYKLLQTETQILRTLDGATIPLQEGNRDYNEYRDWLEAGNQPDEADPVVEPVVLPVTT